MLVFQHNFHGLYLSQGTEKLFLKVVYMHHQVFQHYETKSH